MTVKVSRNKSDSDVVISAIVPALEKYNARHTKADIELYRQNSVSVRIRVVDPDFKGKNKSERNGMVWAFLETLSENVQSDISTVLLLTPDEKKMSFASFEFDDPAPSKF